MRIIGFIGLGLMGKPMAMNLIKAGYTLVVHNRSHPAVDELVRAGATAARSPADVARRVDLLITMLPDSPDVRQVMLGLGGVIEGARAGLVVVDMSSIAPIVSREIAARLAESVVEFLDAPVSGGQSGAVTGTLAVMVGGKQVTFDRCLPILKSMAASVVRVGDVGAGNIAKLANQVIVAVNTAALSEALVLATKAGADPGLVYQAIRGGLAGSALLDAKAPTIMARNFQPGFRLRLHVKDLINALATADECGAPLPITRSVKKIMQVLEGEGLGDADHSALVCHFERLAAIEVRRNRS